VNKIFIKIILCFCFFGQMQLMAQDGTLRGSVNDLKTGEPIMFGTVFIKELSTGTTTDLDGKYSINLAPGTYNVEISYVGYATVLLENMVIKSGEVAVMASNLEENTQVLNEVVVTTKQVKNNAVALATIKRNSSNVIDGITSSSFKQIGDSDAASAIKRVTGVSVDDGKYVYVRGLGDRYTKSILNGMDIPGLDPDRNTLQMDIFPTNILDNILVIKTFTADLPADFTGGVVNITTKDFPEEKTFSISGSLGYNPNMHFNDNYLTYEGGKTDFLGFDDGSRNIPTEGLSQIPFKADATADPNGKGQIYHNTLTKFNPILGAQKTRSGVDYSLGMSAGNQFQLKGKTFGYNVGLTYQNTTQFYENVLYNRYGKDDDFAVNDMEVREVQSGSYGTNNVLLAGIGGVSLKTKTSKYSLSVMRLQNGESKAGIFDYSSTDQGTNFEALQHNLEYSQRQVTNVLLKGTHSSEDGDWNTTWNLSPTFSSIIDPDIRYTRFRTDAGSFTVSTESGIPERIWRYLHEQNYAGNLGTIKNYKFKNRDAKIKFGGAYVYKERSYEIQNFQIFTNGVKLTGDPDQIFQPENLWSSENKNGVSYDPQFLPFNPNKYNSNSSNAAAYISNEATLMPRLKSIIGLRSEYYVQRYNGLNQNREVFKNKKVIDDLNLFPTVSLIYALTQKQNLRVSYARTIARPSFKEASFATIVDPISGRTFIGGFFPDIDVSTGATVWDGNLKTTDINNIDLRWELFQEAGQFFSVSGFYKGFKNPIEIVQYVQAANNFQPRNVGDGMVLGAELELVKNLEFVNPVVKDFSFNFNMTLAKSSIKMSATEYTSRINNARVGETVKDTRDMSGQAPYLINSGFSYKNPINKLEVGFFYNVQGRTLQYVGIADRPDVYSVPFHSLNFNANFPFAKDDKCSLGIKVSNLLNDDREQVFQSFGTGDQYFTRLSPGTSMSLRFSYTFR